MSLSARQLRFCEEYAVSLNATDAAIKAGYSKKTARAMGSENLSKPDIKEKIDELLQIKRENSTITEQMIIEELQSLGMYSIQTFISEGNIIKDLTKLSKAQLRPVIGIKVKETFLPGDIREVTTEIKLADKRGALVDLGRHLGIFDRDNKQKKIKIKVTRK